MSVTSVGALFGYINPDAVGGAASQTVKSADASASASTASPSPSPSDTGAQPDRTGSESAAPRYAAVTGAALISVQERAGSHGPARAAQIPG